MAESLDGLIDYLVATVFPAVTIGELQMLQDDPLLTSVETLAGVVYYYNNKQLRIL